jgi:hypothetical protein
MDAAESVTATFAPPSGGNNGGANTGSSSGGGGGRLDWLWLALLALVTVTRSGPRHVVLRSSS